MATPTKTFPEQSAAPSVFHPYVERRHVRSTKICLRRRHGQLRRSGGLPERRRVPPTSFDIAAALELNLDRFPTKAGMITLLRSWVYAAEADDRPSRTPSYVEALRQAVSAMQAAIDPADAIGQLQNAAIRTR